VAEANVAGRKTSIRLLLPKIVLTVFAVVAATTAPPQLKEKFIVTLPGGMGEAGKPEPLIFTSETPATPLSGAVHVFSFTCANVGAADTAIARATIAIGNRAFKECARFLRFIKITPTRPVIMSIQVLGSGIVGTTLAVVANITARSPSANVRPKDGRIVAENEELMVCDEPLLKVMLRGLSVPVNVASVGSGFVPPIGIVLPLNEIPSKDNVK
jgi:hypothetical protein